MKLSKFVSLLVIGLMLTVAASGCRKKPVGITPIKGGVTGVNPEDMKGGEALKNGEGTTTQGENVPTPLVDPSKFANYRQDAEMFKQDMVFFAYDSSAVRTGEKSKVTKVAEYMKAHPTNALEVDGHCDERGTEEYNRSLGERRALSVRSELIQLGVSGDMIVTKTFGKDRPIEPLHAESAWSKNRRAEFIVLTPP